MQKEFKVAEVKLSYRRKKNAEKIIIKSSEDAYKVLKNTYSSSDIQYRESFKVLYLNNSGEVLGVNIIGVGGVTETTADVRVIMQGALLANATRIILCHNHPSGLAKPSREDISVTHRISEGGKILRIEVVDHIIVTEDNYYSFADEGNL